MFFRMMGQGIAQQSKLQAQGKSTEADLLLALFDRNRSSALKRVMADQFESMEGMMGALEGPKGSTIITERNKVALKKLSEQIAAGKQKIGDLLWSRASRRHGKTAGRRFSTRPPQRTLADGLGPGRHQNSPRAQ